MIPARRSFDGEWLYLGWFNTRVWTHHKNATDATRQFEVEVNLPNLVIIAPHDKNHGRRFFIHKDLIDDA